MNITKHGRKSLSIISVCVITFIILLLVLTCVIGSILCSSWRGSINKTMSGLSDHINQDTTENIGAFLQAADNMNEVNGKLIENGVVNMADEEARNRFFVNVLSSCDMSSCGEYVYSFSYATVNGEYYGARRNENGILEIIKNDVGTGGESWYYSVNSGLTVGALAVNAGKFDPRTRDWYKAAADSGKPSFSPVYKHFVMDDLTVSTARPVYDGNGELRGVLQVSMLLSDIRDELDKIVDCYAGSAFIVEKNTGYLIANSVGAKNFTVSADGTVERTTLNRWDASPIQEAYRQYCVSSNTAFAIKGENARQFIKIREYARTGLDWLVISAVPEGLLTDTLNRNIFITVILVLISILLSCGVYLVITRKLLKPTYRLLEAAGRFSTGDLSQRVAVTRHDEIGRISEAFNLVADKMQLMVNGLEDTVASRTEELHRVNSVLKESQEQLSLILDSTAEAIYGTDLGGICTFCNESCLKMLGYANKHELIGKDMHLLIHHSRKDGTHYPEKECPIMGAILLGKGVHSSDDVLWRNDGTCFDAEYRALPQLRDGEIVDSVLTFIDITVRKKAEEQIRYLSCHDAMTGLKNRGCFERCIKEQDRDANLPISILFIDLNGLKMVNDTFGHAAGDELILKAAEILKRNCQEGDIVARVGGDEFTVLLPQTLPEEAKVIAERLKTEFSREKVHVITCSMALGIDTKFKSYQRIEQTLENAENEMYNEKALSHQAFGKEAIDSIMSALHQKSPREKKHSEEVGRLCGELGAAMGAPEPEIRKLREAGFLHDIGKIALPDRIIDKNPETLAEAEKEMLRQHPVVGYRILNLSEESLDLADGVYGHHERWDGQGYPRGLKGEEIPLIARIIAITEAYERIRNNGSYTVESKEVALREIQRGTGTKFDSRVADLFANMISPTK